MGAHAGSHKPSRHNGTKLATVELTHLVTTCRGYERTQIRPLPQWLCESRGRTECNPCPMVRKYHWTGDSQ